MSRFTVLSLFDGLSGARIALDRLGIECKYYASEVDKYAIQVSSKNYPDIIQLGDVRDIKGCCFSEKINLLIGGSPCQDLSVLKTGEGLNGDKSGLFFEYVRLLKELQPDYFLLENVIPRKVEWKEIIDKLLGVTGVLINSDRFVCQNRPRIYWTNINIPDVPNRPDWNEKYYQFRRTYFRENKSGVCPCLTANMGTGGHNVPLKSKDLKDKLTSEECERLQGIPFGYTEGVSNCQRYKMIGNGFTVSAIEHILKEISI